MNHTLTFRREHIDRSTVSLMPCIDGVALAELVAIFERANGHCDPAGGYGGIVPSHFSFGPLTAYFLGNREIEADRHGEIYALFCECGEAGCWPLVANVRTTDQLVIWSDFAQPHRPKRDYNGFGPFKFARTEYAQALTIAGGYMEIG